MDKATVCYTVGRKGSAGSNPAGSAKKEISMKTKKAPFRTLLSNSIREAGRWITENADDIAGATDLRTHLSITIDYQWDNISPEITIERSHHCSEASKALIGADDE